MILRGVVEPGKRLGRKLGFPTANIACDPSACLPARGVYAGFARLGDCAWPAAINAIGGGALSSVWMQMLADIMNTDVKVPFKPQHAGAAGTACCALVGLGVWSDYAEAANNLPIEKHFRPRPEAVKSYEKNYTVYKQLYSLLKPVFDQMNTAGTEEKNK